MWGWPWGAVSSADPAPPIWTPSPSCSLGAVVQPCIPVGCCRPLGSVLPWAAGSPDLARSELVFNLFLGGGENQPMPENQLSTGFLAAWAGLSAQSCGHRSIVVSAPEQPISGQGLIIPAFGIAGDAGTQGCLWIAPSLMLFGFGFFFRVWPVGPHAWAVPDALGAS